VAFEVFDSGLLAAQLPAKGEEFWFGSRNGPVPITNCFNGSG
jgi:hypothetical protein